MPVLTLPMGRGGIHHHDNADRGLRVNDEPVYRKEIKSVDDFWGAFYELEKGKVTQYGIMYPRIDVVPGDSFVTDRHGKFWKQLGVGLGECSQADLRSMCQAVERDTAWLVLFRGLFPGMQRVIGVHTPRGNSCSTKEPEL